MIRDWFNHFATAVSRYSGHPSAFLLACLIVLIWAATGPFVGYSDFWQLTINTFTTIVTYLIALYMNRKSTPVVEVEDGGVEPHAVRRAAHRSSHGWSSTPAGIMN